MKRILTCVTALIVLTTAARGQFKSFSGSLGYSHQYTDDLIGNTLLTSQTRTPTFDLSTTGIILTDDLAEFDIQTSYLQTSMSSRGTPVPFDFGTQNWTFYRASLSVLQYSPFWILYNARDGYTRSKYEYGSESGISSKNRSRDQSLNLSIRKISFLPPMTLGYNRNRSWTEEGPFTNTLAETYSFSAASSNGSTTMNMSGQSSVAQDLVTDQLSKFSSIRFDGSKQFGDSHNIDLGSEYNWYDRFGLVRTNLTYRGTPDRSTSIGAGINFSQTSSSVLTSSSYSANADFGHSVGEHWQYTVGVGDQYSHETPNGAVAIPVVGFNSWRTSAGLAHSRILSIGSISNSITAGGVWTKNGETSTSYSGGLANAYSNSFGLTRVAFSQGTTVIYTQRFGKYQTQIGTKADLSVDTKLFTRILSTTKISYADNRSLGTFLGEFSSRSISASEGVRGNCVYVIPFSFSAGFSSQWHIGDLKGTTYGWYGSFNSGRFFVDRLSASYQYNRYYDLLYRNASTNHSAQFQYSWRMLSFGLSVYQRTSYSRNRGVVFSVARPF